MVDATSGVHLDTVIQNTCAAHAHPVLHLVLVLDAAVHWLHVMSAVQAMESVMVMLRRPKKQLWELPVFLHALLQLAQQSLLLQQETVIVLQSPQHDILLHGIVQKRMELFRNFAKSNFQKPPPAKHDATYSLNSEPLVILKNFVVFFMR